MHRAAWSHEIGILPLLGQWRPVNVLQGLWSLACVCGPRGGNSSSFGDRSHAKASANVWRLQQGPAKLCLQDALRPALILVPATLILQWAKEIHESWPGLILWILYSTVELPSAYKSNTITASHLKGLPRLDHLPEHLRFLFDDSNRSEIKRSSVILSSYGTWGDSSVDTVVLTGTDKNGEDFQQIDNLCGRCFIIRIAPNTAADA